MALATHGRTFPDIDSFDVATEESQLFDDPQFVLMLSWLQKVGSANSAGGKLDDKMDLLVDERLVNGGWLFERVNGLFNGLANESARISPPVDVVEDHEGYRFSIELPGLKSDSLEVKVEDESLVINAERKEPAWAKGTQVHRAERHYGRIHRAFRLPGDVGNDAIKAVYRDGVLEVTIAKLPQAKPVRVEVAYNN